MFLQVELVWAFFGARARALREDGERGDGILIWVLMTAVLAVAAIAITGLIVKYATSTARTTTDLNPTAPAAP